MSLSGSANTCNSNYLRQRRRVMFLPMYVRLSDRLLKVMERILMKFLQRSSVAQGIIDQILTAIQIIIRIQEFLKRFFICC